MTGSNVVKRANAGEYTLINPLDYMILETLPEEGQLSLGLYPLGETITNIRTKFTPEQQKHLQSSMISGRLVTMKYQKLVASAPGRSADKHLWQRTKEGSRVFNEWKGANGGGSSGKSTNGNQ